MKHKIGKIYNKDHYKLSKQGLYIKNTAAAKKIHSQDVIHGKRKKWATWKYSTTKNSMDDCVNLFNTHVPGKRKKRISVIQYNKKNKKCYGQNSSNLRGITLTNPTSKRIGTTYNNPNWSYLDLRPGYFYEGKYKRG